MPSSILVIEDERVLCKNIVKDLRNRGHNVLAAEDGVEGLEEAKRNRPEIVILDIRLPSMDGMSVLKKIREFDENIQVVMITAYASVSTAVEAMKLGASDYLTKPFNLDELALVVDRLAESSNLKREVAFYRERGTERFGTEAFIGECEKIKRIAEAVDRIAALKVKDGGENPPILVTGETGTGKGIVARLIHQKTFGREKPFMDITCTAIPSELIESELFGYEAGAFTDAKRSKRGLFDVASGGTIFLDEIGHLDESLQGKLLKVLEDRKIRPLGGIKEKIIDARIIAATNRDLEKCVSSGTFRGDLYYRLKVLTIHLPPLRERGDDVILLAEYFLKQCGKKYGVENRFRPECYDLLRRYNWPGNVREVSHVVERAVIFSKGEWIEPVHLSIYEGSPVPDIGKEGARPTGGSRFELPPEGINLDGLEEDLIRQAIFKARGNITRAAQLLGISRDTMRYRLKKMKEEGKEVMDPIP